MTNEPKKIKLPILSKISQNILTDVMFILYTIKDKRKSPEPHRSEDVRLASTGSPVARQMTSSGVSVERIASVVSHRSKRRAQDAPQGAPGVSGRPVVITLSSHFRA